MDRMTVDVAGSNVPFRGKSAKKIFGNRGIGSGEGITRKNGGMLFLFIAEMPSPASTAV